MLKYLTVNNSSVSGEIADLAERLVNHVKSIDKAVLAFSGGVDSSLLACVLKLAGVNFKAVMVVTEFISERRVEEARSISEELGFELLVLRRSASQEMLRNDGMRCYHCKRMIFSEIRKLYPDRIILDGTNASDLRRDRPGLRALKEFGVVSPIAELGIDKGKVREIARHFGLSFHDKPSDSCLATRISGSVTRDKLEFVDVAERVAERVLSIKPSRLRVRVRKNAFEIFVWF